MVEVSEATNPVAPYERTQMEPEIEALITVMLRLGRVFKSRMRGNLLTPPQMYLLTELRELTIRQGGAHPGELAGRCCLSSPAVTAALDELVEKGYCMRTHSETDRRKVLVQLTPIGDATLTTVHANAATAMQEMLRGWDAQSKERLLAVLSQLDESAGRYLTQTKP